jgi:hypothetical protein
MSSSRPPARKRAAHAGDALATPVGMRFRPELVAHGKALVAAGLLGTDLQRLAERLVDLAIEEGEWVWIFDP